MKTKIQLPRRPFGYALVMVLVIGAISVLVLSSSMQRTSSVAIMNDRNNQYVVNLNAAEAAVEKVIARMSYDFQSVSAAAVDANLNLYRSLVPSPGDANPSIPYWNNFQFSDGQGNANKTYVNKISEYSGPLPSQYPGLFTATAPIYRVLSNVKATKGRYLNMTNAVQVDVLMARVPISQYAIFYNGLLEFSTCATMTVNGRTHANNNIFVGSSSGLTFNGTVTSAGTVSAPKNNGQGPWTLGSSANVSFNGNPTYKTNVPTVALSISMTNTRSLIEMRPDESPASKSDSGRLHNKAEVILLISNSTVTARIQASPGTGLLPAQDVSYVELKANWTNGTSWNTMHTSANSALASAIQKVVSTNFPFLTVTNRFKDQRENKTNLVTQIDVAKYKQWIQTNPNIQSKFPAASSNYPTILYVVDNRTLPSANYLTSVRLTNGISPPSNGGQGWSVATPNPLYVWGNYNSPNPSTTDTSGTIRSGLFSDALTILSSNWKDNTSYTESSTGPAASTATTVNAAILTGIKPSTSTAATGFSGGVHNLPRLLENWGSSTLWLNTSIINLFNSTKATGQFVTPGSDSYYTAPTRKFSFDTNFLKYAPPGMPDALVAIRVNWAVPPPNKVNYHVSN